MGLNLGIYKNGELIADVGRKYNFDTNETDAEILESRLIINILSWSKVEITEENMEEMKRQLVEMVGGFAEDFEQIGRVELLKYISEDAEIKDDNGKQWG